MFRFTGAVLSVLLLAGCSITDSRGPVSVRIANAGTIPFDSVVVTFPSRVHVYGTLAAGGTSEYRSVSIAYRYAPVRAYNGNNAWVLQPIDYVGENPLDAGEFTYVISPVDGSQSLALELRRD